MNVLAISGSLRAGSYNRALLRAAQELAPEGMRIEEHHLGSLPFYDGDLEAAGEHEAVAGFKDAIRSADALLVATPEYNRGTSGILKNAIDWASRPALGSPLAGKPVALLGATTGMGGTARAQAQVRDALGFPRALVLEEAVRVSTAYDKFDADLRLTDAATGAALGDLLRALHRGALANAA